MESNKEEFTIIPCFMTAEEAVNAKYPIDLDYVCESTMDLIRQINDPKKTKKYIKWDYLGNGDIL